MTTIAFPASTRIALLRQAVRAQPQSAALLCELSEALAAAGEAREAATAFRQAYLLEPDTGTKALARTGFADAGKLRDYSRGLIDNGVAYSPVIAALAVAEARLGNSAAVQRLVDYDRLFRSIIMDPPDGYDQASFHRALADEIKSDLKFYDVPPSRAIRRAWRHNMNGSALPASQAWVQSIRREVDRYIAALPQLPNHPFPAACPADYVLGAWAVVSNGESHHVSHLHTRAWMSGVYYVVRPPASHDSDSRRGWLEVGPPEQRYGVSTAHGWAARAVEPEPGRLVLMPGYFFHATHPMGVDEERICIAFDVMPVELAGEPQDSIEY
jgi:putative 2-oxoglutarate-Fe(II)-dependent oxygenase superfamily protein